jgi:DNA polymerase
LSLLIIDAGTRSEVDLTLVGSRVYAQHPSTEIILWSVRDPEWERSLVFEEPNLWELLKDLKSAGLIKHTKNESLDIVHWSAFDRLLVEYKSSFTEEAEIWDPDSTPGAIEGPNNTYWYDLMQLSVIYAGPAMLKYAAKFWGGDELKDDGKSLINRFCVPPYETKASDPIRWEKYRAYEGQDTNVMVPILAELQHLGDNGGEDIEKHWPYLRCNDRMNERGCPVDRDSAILANTKLFKLSDKVQTAFEKEHGFKIGSHAKFAKLIGTENAQADTLEEFLLTKPPKKLKKAAEDRLLVGGAATKKLVTIIARTDHGATRTYDEFMYHGAWTRRPTSRGVQLMNFYRHASDEKYFKKLRAKKFSGNIFQETRDNMRGFIKAEPGSVLVAADYSAIECRVSAWLAGEEWLLDLFREGKDPYLKIASEIYGVEVTDKEDPRRQLGKETELGSQYGLGGPGLQRNAAKRGLEISEQLARNAIGIYRETHPAIVRTWKEYQSAFFHLTNTLGGPASKTVGRITFERHDWFIKIIRPSGFGQYFFNPRMEAGQWPDGKPKQDICYTGAGKGGMMTTQRTYGGRIFQGVTQGTATGDYTAEGMLAAEAAGYPPIMNVSDEIVTEVEEIEGTSAWSIASLEEIICPNVPWAEGLPIKAEGWAQERFTK